MQPPALVENGHLSAPIESESHSPSLRLPLARLLQLVMILQSERFPNARRLAEACAVSRRTIYRDLTTLEAAGLSILYRPDRQGYQLARDGLLQPIQLDDKEALALLIMARAGCAGDVFGLVFAGRSAVAKVIQSLPSEKRGRITSAGELIAEQAATLEFTPERRTIHETVLTALAKRRRLRLVYRERESSPPETTSLSVYRLARIDRVWSLVGHSSADGEIRVYGVPWVERVELTDEPYSIPPRFRLERFLRKSGGVHPFPAHAVRIRFAACAAPLVRDSPRERDQILKLVPGGGVELSLKATTLEDVLPWIVGFGDQVEVLEPDTIRNAVRLWAERIFQTHSGSPD
jgi:proteasome accessory factor B